MNQTDTDTPMTDVFYSAEYAADRKGWTDAQFEHARRLERDLAKANADKAVLVEALDAIANQPIGPPTASHAEVLCGIEAIARAALSQVQA